MCSRCSSESWPAVQFTVNRSLETSRPAQLPNMDSLEEDLTCSVCYSLFDDPRVLPCSHTFCKSCLLNVLQVSLNFSIWRPVRIPLKCPNCRSIVDLPPSGVDSLPVNVSLRAIIEKYQRGSEPRSAQCSQHPRQPLNMYCLQDRQLICGICLTIGDHQGHPIDDLEAAYIKERNTPRKLVEQLTNERFAEIGLLIEKLELKKTVCEQTIKEDEELVIKYFEKLHQILEEKKQAFLASLEEAQCESSAKYDPLIENLKYMKEEQQELLSCRPAIEKEESALVFLEKIHFFRTRVATLTEAKLPPIESLELYPRTEAFLEQTWSAITVGAIEEAPIPKISFYTHKNRGDFGRPGVLLGDSQICFLLLLFASMIVLAGIAFNVAFPSFSVFLDLAQSIYHKVSGYCYLISEAMAHLHTNIKGSTPKLKTFFIVVKECLQDFVPGGK
ncbi:tripartite motif-containing protein 59-like [Polypterus senegalus]|uniref:tripartite motif-containing protein 59-like n=1 Tax=Polypterus senegalus TaxID=55291 RepID=UPI001962D541|nr:tripartite motif-containing protein 59-like [Polypterus senegalus]